MQHFNRWWLSIWCVHRKNFFSLFMLQKTKRKEKKRLFRRKECLFDLSAQCLLNTIASSSLIWDNPLILRSVSDGRKEGFVLFCFQSSLSFLLRSVYFVASQNEYILNVVFLSFIVLTNSYVQLRWKFCFDAVWTNLLNCKTTWYTISVFRLKSYSVILGKQSY